MRIKFPTTQLRFGASAVDVDGKDKRPRWLQVGFAGLLALVVGFGMLTLPQLASADPGSVSSFSVAVASDGVAPFDDVDEDANNSQVRTNDLVTYGLSTSFSAAGEVTYTSTLPEGMEWHTSATAATVCDGPDGGSISTDHRTWTCQHTGEVTGAESFNVSAWVRHLPNGATVNPEFKVETLSKTAPTVTVVAEPKTESALYSHTELVEYGIEHNGEQGIQMRVDMMVGATSTTGDFRGYEALADTFDFTLQLPAGAVATGTSSRLGGGTRTIDQPDGPGGDLTVTVSGANTDFRTVEYDPIGATNFASLSQTSVYLWVPYTIAQSGQKTTLKGQLVNFDPSGLGGGSNFGNSTAPGQEDTYSCPTASGSIEGNHLACFQLEIDRTQNYVMNRTNPSAIRGTDEILFGDNHAYLDGSEKIVPGQHFEAIAQIRNGANALQPVKDPIGCVVIDTDDQLLELTGTPSVAIRDSGGRSGGTYMWSGGGFNDVTGTPGVTVTYTDWDFTSEQGRIDHRCWSTSADYTSLNNIPGGLASVTAVKYEIDSTNSGISIDPGRFVGLKVPLKRTTNAASMALPADADLRWLFSYISNEGQHSSVSNHVEAAPVQVRNDVEWSTHAITPGLINELTVQPYVIGPAGGSNPTVADNTRVTLDFDSSCATPVQESLDEWEATSGGTYTYTAPDKGPDAKLCTTDDISPAKVVFTLGDVTAPSGAAGGDFHARVDGHETTLDPINIQVLHSPYSPTGTSQIVTSTISSNSDTSAADWSGVGNSEPAAVEMDRTATAALVISGVSSFSIEKTVETAVDGVVSPTETFDYHLAWTNPTSDSNGIGSFVDVLPFDGDERGTTGLGSSGLEVVAASAETTIPELMGDVNIEYTTVDPTTVYDAIQVPGSEGGDSADITWETGAVPPNATALRFVTTDPVSSGYGGTATITVKAPTITVGGTLVNNVYGRAEGSGTAPAKVLIAQSAVSLGSSAASVSGNIYRDLDFDSTISAADADWPVGTDTVELVDGSTVLTTDVTADGEYSFPAVGPGTYTLGLSSSESTGWAKILPTASVTVEAGDTLTGQDGLYQQTLADPELVDDVAEVALGNSVSIDVTANDTLPLASDGPTANHDGVELGTEAAIGTATLVPGTGGAQGTFTYATSSDWPASASGQTSYEDTFTYTWTSVTGGSDTATVTVTVYADTVAVDDAKVIPDKATLVDVLANDGGDGLTVTNAEVTGGDVTVAIDSSGELQVTPTHDWDGTELSHDATIEYTVTDSIGGTDTAVATITVQRAPQVAGGSAIISEFASYTFDANPLTYDEIQSVDVPDGPQQGTVTPNVNGDVLFDGSSADLGMYTFSVSFTDNLDQTSVAEYTITMQSAPSSDGGSIIIPVGGSHTFDAHVTGSIVSAELSTPPPAGTVTATTDGEVTFDGSESTPAGAYAFEVTFTDINGKDAVSNFTVNVQAPPTAVGGSATIPLDGSHTFDPAPAASTLGSIASTDVTTDPSAGVVTEHTNGTLEFDGAGVDPGTYTFEYTVEDNLGQTATVTFIVIVQAPPTAVGGTVTIPENGSHTFDAAVTSTGDIATAVVTTPPSAGDASALVGGSVSFDASGIEPVVYEFAVTFTDTLDQAVTADYTVTVQAAPTGTGESVTLKDDREVRDFDVLPRVTGTNLEPFTAADVVQPAHGTVTVTNGGTGVTYTPDRGEFGVMNFSVEVYDDLGQSVVLQYEVTIPEPDAPDTPADGNNDTGLASTGSEPNPLGPIGIALLLGGAILALIRQRPRRAHQV